MTTAASAHHRRRHFCPSCGAVHRMIDNDCRVPESPTEDPDRLCQLAGVRNMKPYPYTAASLSKVAQELLHNAVLKEIRNDRKAATASRRLATLRLREAAELQSADPHHYMTLARNIEEQFPS